MLIIISNPSMVHDETNIVNQLFDQGLEVFHLRKPTYTASRTSKFIEKIKPEYRNRISLNHHHEIAAEFNLLRLHFPEQMRESKNESYFEKLKSLGFVLSTSIHKIEDYAAVSSNFNYTFLSPVFDSISKHNYNSILTPDFALPFQRNAKIVALGGVDEKNTEYAFALGFDGIAVLGNIWQDTEKSLNNFKRIQNKCQLKGQLY